MLHSFIICTERKKQSTKTSTPPHLFTPISPPHSIITLSHHHPVLPFRLIISSHAARSIKRLMPQRGHTHFTSGGTYSDIFNWTGASKRLMSQRGHMNSIFGGIYSDISTGLEHMSQQAHQARFFRWFSCGRTYPSHFPGTDWYNHPDSED